MPLSINAADVQRVSNSPIIEVIWGGTVTAGMSVRKDTDGHWVAAQADSAANAGAEGEVGIALNGGGDGQPGVVQTGGSIDTGATTVIGTAYYVGADAAGNIDAHSELEATNVAHFLGVATSTDGKIALSPRLGGLVA